MPKATNRILKPAKLKDCNRLNVRSGRYQDASVNGIISSNDRIKVDVSDNDPDWVVVVEPLYGFSLRKFLTVEE